MSDATRDDGLPADAATTAAPGADTVPGEGAALAIGALIADAAAQSEDAAPAPVSDTIPAEAFDALIGTVLDGRYLITGAIGEGGMGRVYRATHVHMDKQVALKVIHSELAHIEDITRRFEREAKSSSRLTDPHCISVTDFGRTADGTLFLVMELLDGESLEERLAVRGSLPVEKALDIAKQMLRGLAHAHSHGVVHRDLKPENVYLTTHGEETDFVKILDFGIAKLATGGEDTGMGVSLTRTGVVFGTPKYLSPEQALGDKVDRRADLYAVGVLLWEMLTGAAPFEADSAVDLLSMHLTAPVPSLATRGSFPPGLQELIDRAMAKRPRDRFASAEEFLEAIAAIDPAAPPRTGLVAALYGVERRAKRIPLAGRIARLPKRWRVGAVAAAALLLAVIIVASAAGGGEGDELRPVAIVPSEKVGDIGDKRDEVVGLLDRAEAQIRGEKAAEAVITVKEALGIKPDMPPALLLLGHAEFLSGAKEQAMIDYDKALVADRALAADIRLQENLHEALKWATARDKAAVLLAAYGGKAGVDDLKALANSALTDGEVRRTARRALVETKNEAQIDWLTSLTADFNELIKCKQRREVIEQMAATGNTGFLPLLEQFRPVRSKGKMTNACVGDAVLAAIAALTGGADAGAPKP
jgi:tRNA A-37 threonylcarbamoyl transferase component Bud32/tetratricopeptide (TPR) repeat protein